MDAKELIVAVILISLVITVFGFGLKATADNALHLVRRPDLLARSLVAIFVMAPCFALLSARLFEFRPAIEIALVALALSPLPPMMPKKVTKAGGCATYAIALMATVTVAALVLAPLSVELLSLYLGRPLEPPASVIGIVVLFGLAPLAAGMAVDTWRPRLARRIERCVVLIGEILLPLAVLGFVSASLPAMWAIVGNGTIAGIVAFVLAALAVGHWLGGPDPDERVVLALSSACRHPGMALAIASTNFREGEFGATILIYLLISAVIGALYVLSQRRMRPSLEQ